MKKHYLLASLAGLLLLPKAYGQTDVVTANIPLNYIDAMSVPSIVKTVRGIDQLTCDLTTNTVTVRGSRQAVDGFKAEILLADVQPISYRFELRVVRYHVDQKGRYDETVLMSPILLTNAKDSARCAITQKTGGYSVDLTPGPVSGNAMHVAVEVRELGEQGEVLHSGKSVRDVTMGKMTRITGMSDTTNKALLRAVERGEIVTNAGEYSGYYVEVKPMQDISHGGSAKP